MSRSGYHFDSAAKTLEDSLLLFDWRSEGRFSSDRRLEHYQKRSSHQSLLGLFRQFRAVVLADHEQYLHGLYMGPAGCGKSTDLTWLADQVQDDAELGDRILLVHYAIGRAVGMHGVAFPEVAFSMALELCAELERYGSPCEEGGLETLRDLLFGTEARGRRRELSGSVSAGGNLLSILQGALSSGVSREHSVSTRIQHFLPEIHRWLEGVFQRAQTKTGREILFIIDDLEKLTPHENAQTLFLNHGGFFAGLPCHLVFTAPGALRLQATYQEDVLRYFHEFRATIDRPQADGRELPEFDVLRKIVYRRLAPGLATSEAVDEVIRRTGGLLAHLIEAMESAILLAMVSDAEQVCSEHVEKSLRGLCSRFDALLVDADYEVLDRLARSGLRSVVERPALLHSLAILEYPDSPSLFALHPLVEPLLGRWRRAQPKKRTPKVKAKAEP